MQTMHQNMTTNTEVKTNKNGQQYKQCSE